VTEPSSSRPARVAAPGHEGMTAPRMEWALEDALAHPGCAVCRVVRDAENGHWHFFFYEAFQEPDAARAALDGLGFCARHLAQLEGREDAFVSASMALPALEGALAALDAPRRHGLLRQPDPAPRAGEGCPACLAMGRVERDGVRVLARQVAAGQVPADRLHAGEVVCYDHLTLALDEDEEAAGALRDHLRQVLEGRRGVLREFLAAFDYRSEERPAREQAASVAAAWRALRGDPGRLR
jgi:hypothetical protein